MIRNPTTRRPRKNFMPVILPACELEQMLYDAYLAGWNKEIPGFWRHPSTLEKTGEPHTLAQIWARHKSDL